MGGEGVVEGCEGSLIIGGDVDEEVGDSILCCFVFWNVEFIDDYFY